MSVGNGGGGRVGIMISSGTTHFRLFQKLILSRPSLSALARRKFEETSHFLGFLADFVGCHQYYLYLQNI